MVCGANCYVAVKTGNMIEAFTTASNLWPIALVVWVWNGVINKERKDVLSAVVGDTSKRPGFIEVVVNAWFNRGQRPPQQ